MPPNFSNKASFVRNVEVENLFVGLTNPEYQDNGDIYMSGDLYKKNEKIKLLNEKEFEDNNKELENASSLSFSRILNSKPDNWDNIYNWYGPKNIDENILNPMFDGKSWKIDNKYYMNELNILGTTNYLSTGTLNQPTFRIKGGYSSTNLSNRIDRISLEEDKDAPMFYPQVLSGKIIGYSVNYINNFNLDLEKTLPDLSISVGVGKWVNNKWEFDLTGGLVTTGNRELQTSNTSLKSAPEAGYEKFLLDKNNFNESLNDKFKSYELPFESGNIICACVCPYSKIEDEQLKLYWMSGEISITVYLLYNNK